MYRTNTSGDDCHISKQDQIFLPQIYIQNLVNLQKREVSRKYLVPQLPRGFQGNVRIDQNTICQEMTVTFQSKSRYSYNKYIFKILYIYIYLRESKFVQGEGI